MKYSLLEKSRKGLPFLYISILFITTCILLVSRRLAPFTDFTYWYLLPLWFPAAHLLSGISFFLTSGSPAKALAFCRSSFMVYGRLGSPVHAQVAFLTSLLEEMIFRYGLLYLLLDYLHNPFSACILTGILFTLFHLRYGFTLAALLKYLDLLIFSLILGSVNLFTGSFYPAFIMHGMRNYILKVLVVTREEYNAIHHPGTPAEKE